MFSAALDSAPLAFAIALLAGVLAQAIGRHLLVPGIVVLLGMGVLLGPDALDIVRPKALGGGLDTIVGFAVAVILFEGGMRLDIVKLAKEAKVIRRLATLGAVITAVGGAVACALIMGWNVRTSALFGTLVIVTGPTVVGPLVRRIRLAVSLSTILEAEGVFVDAVGAMIAVTALEIALSPSGLHLGETAIGIAERIGTGIGIGVVGGVVLGGALRVPRLVPHGLENVLALASAVAIYQVSHALVPESGIPAAVAAGMVIGNMRIAGITELVEFKEQLTTLLIGLLFVLLAADIRMADVVALGPQALLVVAALSLIVRPLAVLACTPRSSLVWRDKLFVGWIGPRGIVAAAVASLFAKHMADSGIGGGVPLRALVFTVIAVTVTVQGLSAGPLARFLGLRRAVDSGYAILGANPLARYLGLRLQEAGEPVELIDANAEDTRAAEEAGLKVIFGNGLERRVLLRARADTRAHAVALTANESINLLFARRVIDEFYGPTVRIAVDSVAVGVHSEMLETAGAEILFSRPTDLVSWIGRFRREQVSIRRYRCEAEVSEERGFGDAPETAMLPLILRRDDKIELVDARTRVRAGDELEVALAQDRIDVAEKWLETAGFSALRES